VLKAVRFRQKKERLDFPSQPLVDPRQKPEVLNDLFFDSG